MEYRVQNSFFVVSSKVTKVLEHEVMSCKEFLRLKVDSNEKLGGLGRRK